MCQSQVFAFRIAAMTTDDACEEVNPMSIIATSRAQAAAKLLQLLRVSMSGSYVRCSSCTDAPLLVGERNYCDACKEEYGHAH